MIHQIRPRVRHLTLLPALVIAVLAGPLASLAAAQTPASRIPIAVWKTRTCGCCSLWVDHMKANGFDVMVEDVGDLNAIKHKLGVPLALSSCHTAQAGRYVIEGHVPASVVHRLLKERPTTIVGLTVPGMPIGSPGMEVPDGRRQPYAVFTFDKAGQTTIYERR